MSVHAIADRCRDAVLGFVSGTAGGWSRVDLDAWLAEAYGGATAALPRAPHAVEGRELAAGFEVAIMDASDMVRTLLASCAGGRPPSFIAQVVDLGLVVGAQDENGALGHVPVERSSMTLVDRVASLLAADFLTRPNDYRCVAICEECGEVSFEWTACCEHASESDARASGVVRRGGAPVSHGSLFPPPES
ncbi:hypothetical protein BH11MYX4_BH11MYX4_54980 [soil metagenome]